MFDISLFVLCLLVIVVSDYPLINKLYSFLIDIKIFYPRAGTVMSGKCACRLLNNIQLLPSYEVIVESC